MKSNEIRVIKPTEMGGHVARMGVINLENVLVEKSELEDYRHKWGILKLILYKLCGSVWNGFIWFRTDNRCWLKHNNEH
jgi:hypothetical protein